jgi:oligopeptide transport system substrate-binding protein
VADEVVQVLDCEGNPRILNANDFYYGIIRTLKPETASDYAFILTGSVEGAADFNNGVTDDPETVGVKVIDDYTLEITYTEAAAYNAAIASMWVAYPTPSWLIDGDDCTEGQGDRWTETGFNQGYGPYAMKEWVHDSFITIVKNPFWPADIESVPQPKIEEVTWFMLDEVAAFAEYETGNMDATAAPLADLDRIKSDPVLSSELVIAPNLCTYYYGYNTQAPVVDDVRVRKALSMAIDRQSLIDNVLKGEQVPAQWFSRPGLAAAPTLETHPDLGIKSDPEAAKAELQSYLDEKGVTADSLDLTLMFNTSSGHQKIAEAIQQMWKDTLGVTVNLVNQEWAVYLKTTRSADTPQIWRMGWCPDYADANNFIRDVFITNGSSNPDNNADGMPDGGVQYYNPEWEALLLDAAKELDPAKRVEMYAEAEQTFVADDAVIAPIYWYTRVTVTKPYVTRTFGAAGQESVDKWDIDMAAKMSQ